MNDRESIGAEDRARRSILKGEIGASDSAACEIPATIREGTGWRPETV
jgi:hypothetical protein